MSIPRLTALSCALALLAAGAAAGAAPAAPERGEPSATAAQSGMGLVQVGTFDQPTAIAAAPGDARRLFVLEQSGRVRVVRGGRVLARPFIDLSGRISAGGERGLLAMAFDPGYRRNGRFYLYFTARNGDVTVAAFRRTRASADRAVENGVALIRIPHRRFANHNGGQLIFHRGLLYVFTGDGGGAGDPLRNGQDPRSTLGKILRVRVSADGRRVSAVRGNPWRNGVYARGLRNPWRVSLYAGHFLIADVGQNRVEELNVISVRRARGANFGWSCFEGRLRFRDCTAPRHRPPQIQRFHADGHCSIIGGHVVRDPRLPIRGRYLFTDLCRGRLEVLDFQRRRTFRLPLRVRQPTAFGQDRLGRSYVASLEGPVYAILPR